MSCSRSLTMLVSRLGNLMARETTARVDGERLVAPLVGTELPPSEHHLSPESDGAEPGRPLRSSLDGDDLVLLALSSQTMMLWSRD